MNEQVDSELSVKHEVRVANVLFDDRLGGPQKRVIMVGERLKRHGVQTVLMLPVGDGEAEKEAINKSIEVSRVAFARRSPSAAPGLPGRVGRTRAAGAGGGPDSPARPRQGHRRSSVNAAGKRMVQAGWCQKLHER